jgi:hypothetical protein
VSTPFYRYFCNPDPILKLERRWQFLARSYDPQLLCRSGASFSDQLIIYKGEAGDDFVSHEAVRQRHEAAPATRNDTEAEPVAKKAGRLCAATSARPRQGAGG